MQERFSPSKTSTVGKRFNNFKIISAIRDNLLKKTFIECECNCGTLFKINLQNLHGKRATKSCGCLNIKHGHNLNGKSFEYNCWDNMKRRTNLKYKQAWRSKTYINLAKSGKAIDPRWLDFSNFIKDMGLCPKGKSSIGRIDNNKGYFKENCRWENHKEQSLNKSSNRRYELNGENLTLTEWSRKKGIHINTIIGRLARGWTIEEALNP